MKGVLFFVFIGMCVFSDEVITKEEITSKYGEILSIIKKDGKVYLECEEGRVLIGNKAKEDEDKSYLKEQSVVIDNAPTIQEVQEVAIRFAGLSPDNIQRLKRSSKYKALFPKFSINYEKSINYNRDKYVIGPNDWKLSFTWDLADLIYNPDIITIDDKSRYITNLRNEIIKDVTNLYFKRKHLIAKQGNSLEIEELTALIDGYTGGWFSKTLTKDKDKQLE